MAGSGYPAQGVNHQQKLLPGFHYSLKPGGVFILGSSETVGAATDLFAPEDRKWKVFRRAAGPSSFADAMQLRRLAGTETVTTSRKAIHEAEATSALQLAQSLVDRSETPPTAIINDDLSIVYVHGRTGPFLELAAGHISLNILDLVRPGLRSELAAAVRRLATKRQEVVCSDLEMKRGLETTIVGITVSALEDRGEYHGLMMVTFREKSASQARRSAGRKKRRVKAPKRSAAELELELQSTRENLQTTIEELETANEELKSTNEALQSTNEELQSTNEEMETSKEELQSLNEESATVNAELQSRIDELSRANDDRRNLLDSTHIATIFLDSERRVRRFTPRATEPGPLTAADIGRPIGHFASHLVDVDLTQEGESVLRDLIVREAEVQTRDGVTYLMRTRAYRTIMNVIDGVVTTFEDITDLLERTRNSTPGASDLGQVLSPQPHRALLRVVNPRWSQVMAVSIDAPWAAVPTSPALAQPGRTSASHTRDHELLDPVADFDLTQVRVQDVVIHGEAPGEI